MTAPWICRPCDMLCVDREHYERHRDGDHSATTDEERERLRQRYRQRTSPSQ